MRVIDRLAIHFLREEGESLDEVRRILCVVGLLRSQNFEIYEGCHDATKKGSAEIIRIVSGVDEHVQ